MEVVFRQAQCFSSSGGDASNLCHIHSFPTINRISVEFSDKSHLRYYNGPRMAIKEKEMKKKLKLLKGLTKNLSTFSEIGFGLNREGGLDHQVKGQMMSEATEVLLEQLQKLKKEKLELKMKKKEEKAKKKSAARMESESSSSSSSSSSDSEAECVRVVRTSQLKAIASSPSPSSCMEVNNNMNMGMIGNCNNKKKIEVCMGGKCKKSGAATLLENFEKAVVGEEAQVQVVGCKCMGKCRDGPNVRVVQVQEDDPNPNPNLNLNPLSLCMGVGLEDVDLIVNSLFGGNDGSQTRPIPALSGV